MSPHVAHLNFKTSGVSVYKCLSLIVSFAVTVAIWAMSLVRIYPGRASINKRIVLQHFAINVQMTENIMLWVNFILGEKC